MADLQHQIALGERRAVSAGATTATPGRYPLSNAQIALLSYEARLIQDQERRDFVIFLWCNMWSVKDGAAVTAQPLTLASRLKIVQFFASKRS